MRIGLAAMIATVSLTTANAQTIEGKLEEKEPYYLYSTKVPDAMMIDQNKEPLDLDLFVSQSGKIGNLSFSSGGNLCKPVCWKEGSPPREVCLFLTGCGEGGGGGALLERPIIVELAPKTPADSGQPQHNYSVTVRPLTESGVNYPKEFDLKLQLSAQ